MTHPNILHCENNAREHMTWLSNTAWSWSSY